ncbi:MAG: dipeptidase [Anaerolineae bacterium]
MTANIKQIHAGSIIFDGHCDTLLALREGRRRLGQRVEANPQGSIRDAQHLDLPRLIEGGVTAQIFACFVRQPFLPADATNEALRLIDAFYLALEENPDSLLLATTAAGVERAKAEGKVAGILSLEGAEALEGELAPLRMFYRLGVRALGLTWNWRNQAADGLSESRTGGGLTEFGLELVKEANRLGIILDIAHLAPAGVSDVLALSDAPVVASHANARALMDHPRNLSDQQLEGIAASGGLVAVTYVPDFLAENGRSASLESVLDQIDYLVKTVGIDHVGLGSDFDGFPGVLTGLEDVSRLPALTAGLVRRGYRSEEVAQILGGNYLRVFRQVAG